MADVHSKEVRSYNMSRIRAKDTKPEEIVRKYLFSRGLRFRKNDKRYPGHPDIVLPKYKTIVFVNGCFWHAHEGCKYFILPSTNQDFWRNKLFGNRDRDHENTKKLQNAGWHVIVIWECELKKEHRADTLSQLYSEIIERTGGKE